MKKIITLLLLGIIFISCERKISTIQVKNMLPKTILEEIYWGDVKIESQLGPGQSSRVIELDDYTVGIEFPESRSLQFYINLNGDKVYLETRTAYTLFGTDDHLIIEIGDTTRVFNPLLEEQE